VRVAAARPGRRGCGRNGGGVPVSLLVVGGRVCELCPAGSTGRPWPLELWPWPFVASRTGRG
jgi:hypothetical protein